MTSHVLEHPVHTAWKRDGAGGLLRFTLDHFLLLPIGGLIALIWANTAPESYFRFAQTLDFPVNEIGMALFLALVVQEIVEATMPGGALHTWRRWGIPIAGGVGAALGAALVYRTYATVRYEEIVLGGWPAAAAIDIAFAFMLVRVLFPRHPAIPFVLLAAAAADIIGTLAIAGRHAFVDVRPGGVALMAAAIGAAFALRHWRARTFWPYLLICGPLSWTALYVDGWHPALALVPIVPFWPHRPRNLDLFADAPHGAHDSTQHFEHVWQHPVQIVLLLFGLVNAGVIWTGYGAATWALLLAAMIGKPMGLLAGVALAVAAGLHLPRRLHWRDLVVVAYATTAVFTFGLFFATAVYPLGSVLAELKIGAILSGLGVPLTVLLARALRAGRWAHGR